MSHLVGRVMKVKPKYFAPSVRYLSIHLGVPINDDNFIILSVRNSIESEMKSYTAVAYLLYK